MPARTKKVIVVMPAYNAEKTLERTLDDIPRDWVDEIILVDDGSRDRTVEIARSLGLRVFVHEKNKGYGGNQKTCYREALRLGGDIMVMEKGGISFQASSSLRPSKTTGRSSLGMTTGVRERAAIEGGWPSWEAAGRTTRAAVMKRATVVRTARI